MKKIKFTDLFFMILAPLEQFQILSIQNLFIFSFDFSITNFLIINFLGFFIMIFIFFSNNAVNFSMYYVPNSWQYCFELILSVVLQLACDILTRDNEKYIPFLFFVFNFIFFSNIIGLVPYSFTPTSHIFITFFLSFSIFIGINIITITKYGFQSFSIFLPSNTTFFLALVLVPIEFISYIAKPISLGVRLFINIMAGHTLLKVIIGFSWNLLVVENSLSVFFIIPMITLIILFGLELGVALIQTYVFIILTIIYLKDGI